MQSRITLAFVGSILLISACTSTRVLEDRNLKKIDADPDTLVSRIPDYTQSLTALSGKGKAIVSEPNGSERVTVYFSSNRSKSKVTVKSGIGIEGGQILSEGDSMLVYNKVDKIAHKISISSGRLSSLDHLASVNILDMINFTFNPDEVDAVYQSESNFVFITLNGTKIFVDKQNYTVLQVDQPSQSDVPWSRIIYEAYGTIKGYKLPRRVTIFSADRTAKVALLVQSLEINPNDLDLTIDIPKDVKIVTQ